VQKLKAGECHLIIEPAPADLESLKKNATIRVVEGAGLNVGYVAYNTQKKPFDNKLVRQALDLAMNKQTYIDAVYLGNAQMAKNPLPPTIWSYSNKTPDHKFNLKLAQDLLTKAGFPQGFEVTMWTLPVTRPYNPNGKKMGELIQADLAKIGVKVKLISFDWPTYLAKSRTGEHQMIQMGWTGDNGDPDNFFNILLSCSSIESGSNLARWCNQDFNKLINDARLVSDQKKRTVKYTEAQKIFNEEKPWSPIAHSKVFRAMSTKVKGYVMDPLGGDIFTHIQLR
jgi:dipeptide transport system substrate-binding protein